MLSMVVQRQRLNSLTWLFNLKMPKHGTNGPCFVPDVHPDAVVPLNGWDSLSLGHACRLRGHHQQLSVASLRTARPSRVMGRWTSGMPPRLLCAYGGTTLLTYIREINNPKSDDFSFSGFVDAFNFVGTIPNIVLFTGSMRSIILDGHVFIDATLAF